MTTNAGGKVDRTAKPKCECLLYARNRRCGNAAANVVRISGAHEPYRMCALHTRPYLGKAGITVQPINPN